MGPGRRSRAVFRALPFAMVERTSDRSGYRNGEGEDAMKLYTHLNFGGNCEAAFRFYEKHLGGKITMMMRQSELPAHIKPPPGSGANAVIHARMTVAGVELIGNDVPPQY